MNVRQNSLNGGPVVTHGDRPMDQHIAYIEKMVSKGGPAPPEYHSFGRWLDEVAAEIRSGQINKNDLMSLHDAFGRALSSETLQGFSFQKPHGYSGDYEVIDRIYREHVSEDPALSNWDRYFHDQHAPKAVRNRKEYFINMLMHIEREYQGEAPLKVLNVASGPMRDVFEFFGSNGHNPNVQFECVDSDSDAIEFASELCAQYLDNIQFREANALRFTSKHKYQLIWSAGLFDYLADKGFTFLFQHLLSMLDDGGEIVVGKFSDKNPTRNYMEIVGEWILHHRCEEELIQLARSCGVSDENIHVGKEPEGINLFLHVKKGGDFIDI